MRDADDSHLTIPPDVLDFFARAEELSSPSLAINPLAEDRARTYTTAIRQLAIGDAFGLIALDDANDSNPYCYMSGGPAEGMILHLQHADTSTIKFPSLSSFRDALADAKRAGTHIQDLKPCRIAPLREQGPLIQFLESCMDPRYEGGDLLIDVLLPLLNPEHVSLLERLSTHTNFFIRESVAHFIFNNPLLQFQSLAERLAEDRYHQVSNPARQALGSIRKLRRARET
jgi:hypothetical protein